MALLPNSLKARMVLATAAVMAVVLGANATWLVLAKRAELRRGIEERATSFALLSRQPICEGYDTFYASGFYKFRELMKDILRLEPDVENIQIVSVHGDVLFDSSDLSETIPRRQDGATRPSIAGMDRLDAVKRLEPTRLPATDSTGAPALEIVAPYLEDWGRHKLSVIYRVHYRNLRPRVSAYVFATAGVTLVSILVGALAISALLSRIVPPAEASS